MFKYWLRILSEWFWCHIQMGAEIGAMAISHLEEVSEMGIAAMAQSGTVGVLLPTTAYNLRLTPPPARKMLEAGMAVALGSDFNPNAHCIAMVCLLYNGMVTLQLWYVTVLVWCVYGTASVCLM